MKTHRQLTRRDQCGLIGERASRLSDRQSASAWQHLANHLQNDLCEKDIPKFADLLTAIRTATFTAIRNS